MSDALITTLNVMGIMVAVCGGLALCVFLVILITEMIHELMDYWR